MLIIFTCQVFFGDLFWYRMAVVGWNFFPSASKLNNSCIQLKVWLDQKILVVFFLLKLIINICKSFTNLFAKISELKKANASVQQNRNFFKVDCWNNDIPPIFWTPRLSRITQYFELKPVFLRECGILFYYWLLHTLVHLKCFVSLAGSR